MTEHVKIVEDSDGNVSARDCHLYPDKQISATIWENSTEHPYRITFQESPFDENNISVPAKGRSVEAHLRTGVPRKTYAYLMHPANATRGIDIEMAADPNVIVH